MGDVDSVRVALRVRPLVPSEIDRGCQEVVEHIAGSNQVVVNRTDAFTFNHVFDPRNTQEEVYTESVSVLVDKFFGGFNSTILAYGQTGSGKTHTMGTAFSGDLNEDVGVIPRTMHELFKRTKDLEQDFEFLIRCSFMELYQEQLYDLLSQKPREEAIVDIREDRNGIIIPGLTEELVRSAKETTDCLMRGSSLRAVAATAMNQQSSRSHAIFTVTMQATTKSEKKTVTISKFHLVDLAGSERSKKTQATGDRFKEGVKINQGLLALGNVISALGSGQGGCFVRYRDSKLTRLLQDSLGGNSVTLMIACVSPADYNVPETLSTLRYADRARKIRNKPIVNQDPHAAEVNHLKDIIQKLRMELLAAGGNNINMSALMRSKSVGEVILPNSDAQTKLYQQLLEKHQNLQGKYHNVQRQLQMTLHDLAENEMRAHIAEDAHEKLKGKVDEMKNIISELKNDFNVDAPTETLAANVERVEQIYTLVGGLDEELERTQSEIYDRKRQDFQLNTTTDNDENEENDIEKSREVHAIMQEQTDEYTNKQMNFKEQLNRINRELNMKEELHQRVAGNLNKFCTLDNNIDEKFKECETKIQELENEKSELLDKLKHMKGNATAKLAEERRKRLHALEQEINDMKRKNMQQAKLLKVREKETQKIKNLHSEIQAMKESKVKLIRAMRHEAEVFRQWKFMREKELMQLKNKDRKMQNEMARKEALHSKQRNVLKRKCEEAMAINKRLKDALDRQRIAQTQRQKTHSAKDNSVATNKIEQVITYVERELEVILSLIDAEHSLEQLMEDRSIIKRQIGALNADCVPEPDTDAARELANLEEELEMRNAQIADLQQKVCAADLDACMRNLLESIQNVTEARAMVKQLLTSIGDMRREHLSHSLEQKAILEEQRQRTDAAEEQCKAAAKRVRLMEIEHEEAIVERENTYEEKIAVLLRELHSAPQLASGTVITPEQEERLRIQEEQLNKMDTLREELEHYRNLVNQMEQAVAKTVRKQNKKKKDEEGFVTEILSSDESDEILEQDYLNDPDWKGETPFRRNRSSNKTLASKSDNSTVDEESFVTAATRPPKRRLNGCKCRGNCSTKRCGCCGNQEKCTINCRCSSKCSNGKSSPGSENGENGEFIMGRQLSLKSENEDIDSTYESTSITNNDSSTNAIKPLNEVTFVKPELVSHLTPKIARLSHISFDTPSAKKKFFD